jgi:hypothetical protein
VPLDDQELLALLGSQSGAGENVLQWTEDEGEGRANLVRGVGEEGGLSLAIATRVSERQHKSFIAR